MGEVEKTDSQELTDGQQEELLRIALSREGSWLIRAAKQPGFVAIVISLISLMLILSILLVVSTDTEALTHFLDGLMKFQIYKPETP